jgi:hypothetical protein
MAEVSKAGPRSKCNGHLDFAIRFSKSTLLHLPSVDWLRKKSWTIRDFFGAREEGKGVSTLKNHSNSRFSTGPSMENFNGTSLSRRFVTVR